MPQQKSKNQKSTRDQIIDSALNLGRSILDTDALTEHKRDFLSVCIWKVTEADGKHNLRYWSEGVYTLVQKHSDIKAVLKQPLPIQHEHVNPISCLVDKIMNNPACLEKVLREEAIACLITKEEHDKLDNSPDGFARYEKACIRVWDRDKQQWIT